MNESPLVIHDAEVDGRTVDVHVTERRISAITDLRARARPRPDARIVDASGGALLPGLHDHHIHLLALAAARRSLVLTGSLDEIGARAAVDDGVGWMRITGYHESEHGPLDRHRLDALAPHRPARVQHQTGTLWILNSAALDAIGLSSHPDGLLYESDADLRDRVPREPIDLAGVARQLASYGVTGLTDATPTERRGDVDVLVEAVRSGAVPQRLAVMGGTGLAAEVPGYAGERIAAGPMKLVIGDVDVPALDEIIDAMLSARRFDRAVAVHAVTRVGLVLALAAWEEVGVVAGDRVEHGGVVVPEAAERLAELGLVVVTQPSFVRDRGDRFLRDVDADDIDHLYPCGRLLDAGVGVGGSTDAPFGDPDPWRAIGTAIDRRTRDGRVLGADDRVAPMRALELFLGDLDAPAGPPRRIAVGAPADLCLLQVPLADALRRPSSDAVRTVLCDGAVIVDREAA